MDRALASTSRKMSARQRLDTGTSSSRKKEDWSVLNKSARHTTTAASVQPMKRRLDRMLAFHWPPRANSSAMNTYWKLEKR